MKLEVKPYTLHFTFTARTSRGSMTDRKVWFLQITSGEKCGVGEVAPIPRLSPDDLEALPEFLEELHEQLVNRSRPTNERECYALAKELAGENFPSVRFGLEAAFLSLMGKEEGTLFENDFSAGKTSIPINGLVWMDEKEEMIRQVDEKLEADFDCIKLKVGALDFEEELEVLKYLREKAQDVTVRLDANGAFETNEVLQKLNTLAEFGIHSIEQPIAPRQEHAMKLVISKSPIPIALDEELIGVYGAQKAELLDFLKPHFIVLKPTLLGGLQECAEWIALAKARNIGWWVTSYLESNVGLNAIAQFVANYDLELPQGLGTGGLYANNVESNLSIESGHLRLGKKEKWISPFT